MQELRPDRLQSETTSETAEGGNKQKRSRVRANSQNKKRVRRKERTVNGKQKSVGTAKKNKKTTTIV